MNKIEYQIPEGYEARIEGNKVILELKDEDAKTRRLIRVAINNWFNSDGMVYEKESVEEMKSRCFSYLEKQGKQKPAWSEEDSPYYDDICEILINLLYSETADVNKDAVQKDLDWLKSLKDRFNVNNEKEK